MNLVFVWPLCFLLFVPLALAAWRMLRRGKRVGIKFAPLRRLPAKTAGWRARVANMAPWLFLAGAALLVVASARPRTSFTRTSREVDSIAIAMAVDVSGSMRTPELTPHGEPTGNTRLDVVKEVFKRFVKVRHDDLIALVTFGTYASTLAPLTADHEMLLNVLEGVQIPTERGEQQTAIGDGLSFAIDRVKDAKIESKVVILLSDGVSITGSEPDEAADIAAKLGIRVYTIGVGDSTQGDVPRLVMTPLGPRLVYNRDFDEAQLKSIADKTGGRYFNANDEDGLTAALDEIDSLEKTKVEQTVYQRWYEYFPWFLMPGAILVLVAVLLQTLASRRLV